MNILGYILYAVLVSLALTWGIGVRKKLGASSPVVIGALIFFLGAVIIPITGISLLHAAWVIALGYCMSFGLSFVLPYSDILKKVTALIAGIYSGVIRVGIDKKKIKQAQEKSAREAVENLKDRKQK